MAFLPALASAALPAMSSAALPAIGGSMASSMPLLAAAGSGMAASPWGMLAATGPAAYAPAAMAGGGLGSTLMGALPSFASSMMSNGQQKQSAPFSPALSTPHVSAKNPGQNLSSYAGLVNPMNRSHTNDMRGPGDLERLIRLYSHTV